jgi:dTMP kinase
MCVEGKFIVIEGADGTGKTTQAEMLVEYLEGKGLPVVAVREPGGTQIGKHIRSILRNPDFSGMSLSTELLLYMASRAQLVEEVLKPALVQGKIVVADRFLLSSIVYQGTAGGLGEDTVTRIAEIVTGGLRPTLTIVINLRRDKWLKRRTLGRAKVQIPLFEQSDREELKGLKFHEKVRKEYLRIAKRDKSIVVINGNGTPQAVHERIVKAVEDALR